MSYGDGDGDGKPTYMFWEWHKILIDLINFK